VADFDRDQKATMSNQTAGHDRLFGCLWPRESDNASAAQEFFLSFVDHKGSLPCSQETVPSQLNQF